GWAASGCNACSRSMKPTCNAAERVSAGGSQRRYSQGRGSNRKHSGQWNSNIMMAHPAAQLCEQGLALCRAQVDLRSVEIRRQRLQRLALGPRIAAAEIIEPGLAKQPGRRDIAPLLQQLLDPGVDRGQPLGIRQAGRHIRDYSPTLALLPPLLPSGMAQQPGQQ